MKIRMIMDCLFSTCNESDQMYTAAEKMVRERTSHLVVVDHMNRYRGVINASSLLEGIKDWTEKVNVIIKAVQPINENDSMISLISVRAAVDCDIIPIVNNEQEVVGILSVRSLMEYLPELIGPKYRQNGHPLKNKGLSSKYTINDIIGQSMEILSLKETIIAAAKTQSTVLISGETGTGKELVAHAIHSLSERRHLPFVRISCAAIPENLLESELFGYEAGSFTGAVKGGQRGKFELASGGTIFLDEIGDMPLPLQAKILRVLQEREIEKIGGPTPIPVDVRVISATHRDLKDLVKSGKFREDLFYRLHVIPINTPPLRDYIEDIPLLVEHFLSKFSVAYKIDKPRVERKFMDGLLNYTWAGNVRELVNILDMATTLSKGVITYDHLQSLPFLDWDMKQTGKDEAETLRICASEAERDAILKTIKVYQGNKVKVAESLGISRSSLYNKLRKYNIEI